MRQATKYFTSLIFLILYLSGCATVPGTLPPHPLGMPGVYHRVEKGQTLWRISKMYDVDLEELVRINHISDAANIEINQLVFIPGRKNPLLLPAAASGSEDFIWPLKGKVIAAFGQIYNQMVNKGVNIQPDMDTNVLAARKGRVVFYDPNFQGYGKTIIIDHADGFSTVYARNAVVFVKVGQEITQGMLLSKLDSGKGKEKKSYLHFEIRKGHLAQNPYFYLP